MGSPVDVSDLLRTIRNLQEEDISCPSCFVYYTKKWCKNTDTDCFFCTNFVPYKDTYKYIRNNIDWYYINSDDDNHALFCKEFKYNLKRWINEFPKPNLNLSSWLFQ